MSTSLKYHQDKFQELESAIEEKISILGTIKNKCERENRSPTNSESERANTMLAEIDQMESTQKFHEAERDRLFVPVEIPYPDPQAGFGRSSARVSRGYEKRGHNEDKAFAFFVWIWPKRLQVE